MPTRFSNTTDLPDQLIAIAVAHAIQPGVEIDEIIVKNKKSGKFHGQWGWYYPSERKLVLIVPQVVRYGWTTRLPYSGAKLRINSRGEWLIAVMAHELRHAWQWQKSGDADYRSNKALAEIDAEAYEVRMLKEWQAEHGEVIAAAASISRE